jgi:hypothetical protein
MRRSLLLIPVVAVLAGAMTACTDRATGQAVSTETTRSTGSSGPFSASPTRPGTTTSQPGAAASPLKDTDPCSLISDAEAAALRAGPGTNETLNNARVCQFKDADGFSMSVGIFDDLGLNDVVANGPIKPVPTVGRHKAVQSMGGIRTCAISIEVTPTSRVDTTGTTNQPDDQKSCAIALQVAKLVEPRLP